MVTTTISNFLEGEDVREVQLGDLLDKRYLALWIGDKLAKVSIDELKRAIKACEEDREV